MSQEIIFTTLPHRRIEIDGKPFLQLSVFATIKLTTPKDTTLAVFEDILAFPDKMLEGDFQFKLQDGTLLNAEMIKDKIDPELFRQIFHRDIKVDDFKDEDFTEKRFYSFPVKHINDFLIKSYKEIAISNPKELLGAEIFVDENRFAPITRMKLDAQSVENAISPNFRNTINASQLYFKNDNDVREFKADLQKNKFTRFVKQMQPREDFVQLRQFHKVDKELVIRDKPVKMEKPRFEFHDILSVVNSYPQMMRKLGLVLDFLIPYTTTIPNLGSLSLVINALELDEEGTTISTPLTAYQITSTGFYTGDKPTSIFKKGFVKINTDAFSVIQIDADGTALKANNMAETKIQELAQFYEQKARFTHDEQLIVSNVENIKPPEEEGLPYSRSAGIAITKNGMAEHLVNSINSNLLIKQKFVVAPVRKVEMKPRFLNQTSGNIQPVEKANLLLKIRIPETILYSDDVTQGYRMDIAYDDEPDKWYSLHQRQDAYTWYNESNNPSAIEGIEPDEGFIQLGIAEDPDDPDDVFVSETLARWEGWSLSVQKPGYAINESDDYDLKPGETEKRDFVYKNKLEEAKKYRFDPDLEFRLNAQSKIIPGSLPKLRFGRNYRVRVRSVDLAGNSVPLEHQSESPLETLRENIRYMRYEPLASPIVLAGNKLKDGEFLERLVIRSNFDQTATEYENNHPLAGNTFDPFSQRYLLPPKNSQLMAETHGKFEEAFKSGAAAKEIYDIITNHEGLYQQDEKNKEKIYQPSEVEIIYLPDPMAAGVSFFVAEGNQFTHTQEFEPAMFSFFSKEEIKPNDTNSINIPNDWYKAGIIRIRLEEGEQKVNWDGANRIFTVFMPKGHRTRIKFSTFWREEDMKQLSAIWAMVKSENPGNLNELQRLAFSGQHWMVSPSREFELVHALQQPLDAPVIKDLIPDRDYNTTFALINTRFDIHGQSTEKVQFQAKWTEPLDDGISVEIKEKQGRNQIPEINLNYHDDVLTKGTIPEPQEIKTPAIENLQAKPILRIKPRTAIQFEANPQPGARKVNLLYQNQNKQFVQVEKLKISPLINLAQRVKYDIAMTQFNFLDLLNLRIKPLEHHFGDTKHRWVDYKLVGTSRYGDYFSSVLKAYPSLPVTRDSEWKERVNILSSARPLAPGIEYIIPTFEWRKSQNDTTVRHQRMGGGLRIYLKRPWYSTGEDEMLAVILPQYKQSMLSMVAASPGYTNYYTHWGIDPILYGQRPANVSPGIEEFRLKPVIDSGLQYPGQPGALAKVVAYPVHFDTDRQMWFCDIAIDPGQMYFPFVKLFLARYQPHSVREENSDVCLSPIVAAKMTQLMPERKATLTFKKDDQNSRFTISVEGNIYNPGDAVYGNYNFLKISFLDSRVAQPIYGLIDDGSNQKKLQEESIVIPITREKLVSGVTFKVEREFKLHRDYKTAPFQVVIEEYERGPSRIPNLPPEYVDRLEQSEQTDRLIFADVIKINEV